MRQRIVLPVMLTLWVLFAGFFNHTSLAQEPPPPPAPPPPQPVVTPMTVSNTLDMPPAPPPPINDSTTSIGTAPIEAPPPPSTPGTPTPSSDVEIVANPEAGNPATPTTETASAEAATGQPTDAKPPEEQSTGNPDNTTDTGKFIKGELIYPGMRRLISRFDYVGVAFGPAFLGGDLYLSLTPGGAFYFEKFSFAFGVPLNLMLFNMGSLKYGGLRLRREDWDEVGDFTRVIRFVTYGRKEDNLYLTINSIRPSTLGYGMLIDQYQPNIDVDRFMAGFTAEWYNKYGGFQFQANDITFYKNRIIGALGFIKPATFFTPDPLLDSISVGIEYVGDFLAPRCIRKSANSNTCIQGSGQQAGYNPYTGVNLDKTFVRTDPKTGRFVVENGIAHAIGFSGEIKVYKDPTNIDIKAYTTFHQFVNPGGGNCFGLGALARLNIGDAWKHAFRITGEYRTFGNGFMPGYFDSLYEIQKYQYITSENPYQVTPTKYQAIFGDPKNGFERPNEKRRHGVKLDASWGLFKGGRSGKKISAGFGFEESTAPDDTDLYVHVELPILGWLQIFGTYMKLNEPNLRTVFSNTIWSSPNTVLLTGLRLEIWRIFFINAHYSRSFQVVRSPGSEYHLGNDRVVDVYGRPSPFFKQDALFETVQALFVELEFGWRFKKDEPEQQ